MGFRIGADSLTIVIGDSSFADTDMFFHCLVQFKQ